MPEITRDEDGRKHVHWKLEEAEGAARDRRIAFDTLIRAKFPRRMSLWARLVARLWHRTPNFREDPAKSPPSSPSAKGARL